MGPYDCSRHRPSRYDDRSFTLADLREQGRNNFEIFNGAPANATAGSRTLLSSYTGTGVASPPCDLTHLADLLPQDNPDSMLVKVTHDASAPLALNADIVLSKVAQHGRSAATP